ncbi:MAG: MBL fold metallo-hydrolase [Clostridia bacterium]
MVKKIEVSISQSQHITNSYLIYDETKDAILLDPGDEAQKIIDTINSLELKVKYICITHAHADHMGALEKVLKYTNAKILIHENDVLALFNKIENYCDMLGVDKQNISKDVVIEIVDGYEFSVGNLKFEVIHTPGHTSGSICIFEKTSNMLFTGDTIFSDCYGRCDLQTGSIDKMVSSINKLFLRFSNIEIYPGHNMSVNIDEAKKKIRLLLAMKGIALK